MTATATATEVREVITYATSLETAVMTVEQLGDHALAAGYAKIAIEVAYGVEPAVVLIVGVRYVNA